MLFEEDDTYWEPASDANELYKQLSAKKYREIVRQQIQYVDKLIKTYLSMHFVKLILYTQGLKILMIWSLVLTHNL